MDKMRLRDALLDFFFPCGECLSCGSMAKVRDGLCEKCREKLRPAPAGGRPGFGWIDDLRCVYAYDGPARELIRKMKFRGEYDLPVRLFAREMARLYAEAGWKAEIVVCAPASRKTLRRRGYNQAEKLARRTAKELKLPFVQDALKKKRGVRSQVGLNAQQRIENMQGAVLPGKHAGAVEGKSVLLIDDVLTTGSTAEACAKALREAGAKEISEADMLRAILTGHEEIKKLVAFQKQIVAEIGKEKRVFPVAETGEDVKAAVRADFFDRCAWAFEAFDRHERSAREEQVKQEAHELYAERFEGRLNEVDDALYYLNKEIMRTKILEKGVRPDGRSLTQIRPIWCETGAAGVTSFLGRSIVSTPFSTLAEIFWRSTSSGSEKLCWNEV